MSGTDDSDRLIQEALEKEYETHNYGDDGGGITTTSATPVVRSGAGEVGTGGRR